MYIFSWDNLIQCIWSNVYAEIHDNNLIIRMKWLSYITFCCILYRLNVNLHYIHKNAHKRSIHYDADLEAAFLARYLSLALCTAFLSFLFLNLSSAVASLQGIRGTDIEINCRHDYTKTFNQFSYFADLSLASFLSEVDSLLSPWPLDLNE